jgi:hypothetical protein
MYHTVLYYHCRALPTDMEYTADFDYQLSLVFAIPIAKLSASQLLLPETRTRLS